METRYIKNPVRIAIVHGNIAEVKRRGNDIVVGSRDDNSRFEMITLEKEEAEEILKLVYEKVNEYTVTKR